MSVVKDKTLMQINDNAVEELQNIEASMRIMDTYSRLSKEQLDSTLKKELQEIVLSYGSLFSVAPPEVEDMDFETVLLISNQEIKVGRLLKERGLYRLVKALDMTDDYGLPLWQQLINEATGEPFERQDDMINAFVSASHISRQTVYSRLSLYRMMVYIGFTMEEAYKYILMRPTVMYKSLLKLGFWERGNLQELDIDVASAIVNHYDKPELISMVNDVREGGSGMVDSLKEELKPVLRGMIDDIASFPNVKEATKYLSIDILSEAMVSYYWNSELDVVVVKIGEPVIDEFGNVVQTKERIIPLFADTQDGKYPEALRMDLINRLPIRNRKEIE